LSDLLGRFRYPLTYLVLALASVLSLVSRDAMVKTGPASQLFLEVTVPIQEMVALPVRELRSVWDSYVSLVGVRQSRDKILSEVAQLRAENLELKEALVASERFQRFGDFREDHDLPLLPATVSAEDLSPWFKSITIDQGAADGVEPGMPVITDEGVVGVVSGTSPRFSRVLLMIDPQSQIDTYTQRSRARGSARGGADGSCSLQYVLRESDIREGDDLLTSGLDGIYPKGLRIGKVAKVEKEQYGLFQRVEVEPAVDFYALEEVFVLLERRELPGPGQFSSENDELWAVEPQPDPADTDAAAESDLEEPSG